MSIPLKPDDPCQFLLQNPNIYTIPVFNRKGCYICEDPEFAEMGLPLCYKCMFCEGHVPADSNACSDCGKEQHE